MLTSTHETDLKLDGPWELAARQATTRAALRRTRATRRRRAVADGITQELAILATPDTAQGITYVAADPADWDAFYGDTVLCDVLPWDAFGPLGPTSHDLEADEEAAIFAEYPGVTSYEELAQAIDDEQATIRTPDLYGSTFDPDELQWGFTVSTRPAGANCR